MYSSFILNLHLLYDINTWPRNPTNNFTLKNCLFGAVKLTRNANKSKFVYNGPGTAFDGKDFWSFDNKTARNVIISEGINYSVGAADKKLLLTLLKQIQYFA